MALFDAVFGAIADLTNMAIKAIARKVGGSAAQVEQVERCLFWIAFLCFISIPVYLTFRFS